MIALRFLTLKVHEIDPEKIKRPNIKVLPLPIEPNVPRKKYIPPVDHPWRRSFSRWHQMVLARKKARQRGLISVELFHNEVDEKKGLLFDQTIKLTAYYQSRHYPDELRLVGYKEPDKKKELVFLSNNFTLSAYTITQIYKARWQIEIFFNLGHRHI